MNSSRLTNCASFVLETDSLPAALERARDAGAHFWFAEKDNDERELPLAVLLERAAALARALLDRGLRRGERAMIMLPTSEAWLVAFFGVLLAGGVAVPVGPSLSFGGMDRYAKVVRRILAAAEARFLLGNASIERHLSALTTTSSPLQHFIRADLPVSGAPGSFLLPSPEPDAPALIQYTSGTTGDPKGVVLSHRALLANAFMIGERSGMSSSDVGVSWLPLFHDMGLVGALLTALYFQYPLLLMPVESFLLQPRRWLQWLARKGATLSVAPNFAYQLVLQRGAARHLDGIDLSHWRSAFNGSELVRPDTLRNFSARFEQNGFVSSALQPVYGMAENALAATFPRPGEHWHSHISHGRELVSVGTPLLGVEIDIVDDANSSLPEGTEGRIRLKSPSLMQGYFRNERATESVFRDGFLQTGDLGLVHQGELYVTGRSKEVIIKRGRNYPPEDFEALAVSVGKRQVLRAVAFGVPDDQQATEHLVLVLETRPLTAQERELLSRRISATLIANTGIGPDVTEFVPPRTIERTTSGKLRRASLRQHYLEGHLPDYPVLSETTTQEVL